MLVKLNEAPGDFVFEIPVPDGYSPAPAPGDGAVTAGVTITTLSLNVIEIGTHLRATGWTPGDNSEPTADDVKSIVASVRACSHPVGLVGKLGDAFLYTKYTEAEVLYAKMGERQGPLQT